MKKLTRKEIEDIIHYEKIGDSLMSMNVIEDHDKKVFDKIWYGVGKKEFGYTKRFMDSDDFWWEDNCDFLSSVKWELFGTYGISERIEKECF